MPLFPSRATSLFHHLSPLYSPFIRLPCLGIFLSLPSHSFIQQSWLFYYTCPTSTDLSPGHYSPGRGGREHPASRKNWNTFSSTFALAVSTTVPVSRIRIAVLSGDGEKRCIADPAVSAWIKSEELLPPPGLTRRGRGLGWPENETEFRRFTTCTFFFSPSPWKNRVTREF